MPDQEQAPTSRFLKHLEEGNAISRRTVLLGAVGASAAAFLAACSSGDSSELSDSTNTAASSDSAASSASAASSDTTVTGTADTTAAASSASGSGASEMVVNFTYEMGSGGKQANPYVAVWVEDSSGAMIDTIAVYFLQSSKGTRYLSDLSSWYSEVNTAGVDYTAVSSATQAPGAYSVSWTGPDGTGLPAGDYIVNIESAREHGPDSLVSQPITVAGAATVTCEDSGELVSASIELKA